MDHLPLSARQRAAYTQAGLLAHERFAARAGHHAESRTLPVDDLKDLARAGLLNLAAGEDIGGGGSGIMGHDPLLYLLVLDQIARHAGLATSHSLQVHSHALHFVDQCATQAQRRRLLAPIIAAEGLTTTLSSEPGRTARGPRHTTLAHRHGQGFVISGTKNFATLAAACSHLLVLVDGAPDSDVAGQRLALLVPVDAPGVRIEDTGWNPYGMRAGVSPLVHFDRHEVPEDALIGPPGAHADGNWSVKADLGFAAQYVGAAHGILESTVQAARRRGVAASPAVELRLGEAWSRLAAARWHYYGAAKLWETRDEGAAGPASQSAKVQAVKAAEQVLETATRIAGPSAFDADSELTLRSNDLRYLMMREQPDALSVSLGKALIDSAAEPVAAPVAGIAG